MSTPETETRMRVRVTLTVEVDPDAWTLLYGCDDSMSRAAIRADVRQYAKEQVSMSPAADEGAITAVRRS